MYRSMMLINGEQVEGASFDIIHNPANQEPVAEVVIGEAIDAVRALEAAQRAFPEWSSASQKRRCELLHDAAEIVRERADHIAELLTMEMGKPIRDSRREVLSAADTLDYFAEEGMRNIGDWISTGDTRSIVTKQPVGVVSLITPWNYPVELLAWKVGPALASGCTAVAKPSSLAPVAATEFVMAVNEAGLPPGVLNIVHGSGDTVGAELVTNPISRKISFTGETSTGRWIMEAAARHLKRVSLELGGHAPMIVFDDADIDAAASACVRRAFGNMGQVCISVNRVYVADAIAEDFTERVLRRTLKLRIGDPLDPEVDLGPMVSERQRRKTREHIEDAVRKGARILCGGREPEGSLFARGYYFMPTVLTDVDHTMRMMREETFGPVAPIMRFSGEEEAVRLANDTEYGLAAYIYTDSLRRAVRIAERIEAGSVGVNLGSVIDHHAPFGGWKQSGIGRELSHRGLDEYMEIKHIRLGL
ncbi:MAG: NAD-dependent succinate-semialdehyde dehydrogenase [Methanothrix sp.]|uniref:NAD-dependent succinate-semialdehyde dehydrogenase n=1 Tax=Methanothrix sp. TaxID=90426 RepID=UPI0025E24D77|nr:NAD-dependent succinate-semialdehyde dehydrogenase [Methanothrix sp.]MCQ8903956.1 NAD-dependent succinate-semialdehyde dehydrogenase [Methanothrix sp.]